MRNIRKSLFFVFIYNSKSVRGRCAVSSIRYTAAIDAGGRQHEFQPDVGNQQFIGATPCTALAQQRNDPNNA
jgi:hypothetical protein